jgi:hypothetical protein
MRHIKIYEDYTDDELRDLQDVLHDIGHDTRWTYGEDFGFGLSPEFKTEITGDEYPSMSREFFNHLFYRGDIVPKGMAFEFKSPEDFGVDEDFEVGISPSVVSNRYGIHIKPKDPKKFFTRAEMAYVFAKVIQKLGEIRK